jgi:hypothetical protein
MTQVQHGFVIPAEAGIHKRGLSEESKYLDEIGF